MGEAVVLANGVRSGFDLIKGLGYPVYPKAKTNLERRPMFMLASMLWGVSRIGPFRRLLATGEAEAGFLVDDMVAAAARSKQPVDIERIRAMKP